MRLFRIRWLGILFATSPRCSPPSRSTRASSPACAGGSPGRSAAAARSRRRASPASPTASTSAPSAAASGGRTTPGRTWEPIFDSQPVASIGAIAVAPSDPNVLYVGSGEADMRSDISYGNGMYKSIGRREDVDAHRPRGHAADRTDPRRPGRRERRLRRGARARATARTPSAASSARRTAGRPGRRVLFKDENTGAIDLAFDPGNSRTILAALWQTRRPPWNVYPPSNGPGSGL